MARRAPGFKTHFDVSMSAMCPESLAGDNVQQTIAIYVCHFHRMQLAELDPVLIFFGLCVHNRMSGNANRIAGVNMRASIDILVLRVQAAAKFVILPMT